MSFTRRDLLKASALLLGGAGCIVPSRESYHLDHVRYPGGAIPRIGGPGIKIGAAKIDITPPLGARTWLAGYGFQRVMREVRDPIFATALYIEDGERRVALVVADVIGLLAPSVSRVRRLVGNNIELAVASTHNHQSPDTMGYWGPAILYAVPYRSGVQVGYQRVFERRLAVCVARAARSAKPATLRFGRAALDPSWVQNLRNPGVFDPAIEVVAADDRETGEAIATLVNLGCHPETLGDRAHRLSADFPGRLRAKIEESRGGTAVFANGILGGMITPNIDLDLSEKERSRTIDRLGELFAAEALKAIAAASPVPTDRVRYRRKKVELEMKNALFDYVARVGLVEDREAGKNGGLVTEVGRIDLGPLAIALVPGEPTPKVGLRIKQSLRAEHTMVIALAGDELGYILDPAEFADPEFAYETTVSVGPETAPTLEAALAQFR